MKPELFQSINPPIFYQRQPVREAYFVDGIENKGEAVQEKIIVQQLEVEKLRTIVEVLAHPAFEGMIRDGNITLGAVKPNAHRSKIGALDDVDAERVLISSVQAPLEIIATVSLPLTESDLEVFYPAELKQRLLAMPEGDSNSWDAFREYMLSGPITYAILYDPNGHAVDEWRKQIGSTNPKTAATDSIRGRFAYSIRENLVHGSSGDSPEEKIANVTTETGWLKNKLKQLIAIQENNSIEALPELSTLIDVGIIKPGEELLALKELAPFKRRGAESFHAVYSIAVVDSNNKPETRYLAIKAIVTMGGTISQAAQAQFSRLEELQRLGVKTPKLYGVKDGDIYEEFIVGEQPMSKVFEIINNKDDDSDKRLNLIAQLSQIAAVLDSQGYIVTNNFYDNLVFNGSDLYFVDGGSDLGEKNIGHPTRQALETLIKKIKDADTEALMINIYNETQSKI